MAIEWSSDLSDWSLLVCADILFLMSSTAEGLAERCRAHERALAQIDLHFSASSIEVLPHAMVAQALLQMQMEAWTPDVRHRTSPATPRSL